MSLKTEYSYNEDDFIQNGNDMKELTVTITLCEYRNLVRDLSNADTIVERLQEENKKLTEQNQALSSFIVSQNPEMIQGLGNAINSLFNKDETQAEPVQGDTEQKEIEGE